MTQALAFGTFPIYVLSFDSAGVELTSTRTIDSVDDLINRAKGPGALALGGNGGSGIIIIKYTAA